MNITFEELRRIKHALPSGSIARIAQELNLEEQTVRNYFGAHQYKDGHLAPMAALYTWKTRRFLNALSKFSPSILFLTKRNVTLFPFPQEKKIGEN
jgi:hypothetical protein